MRSRSPACALLLSLAACAADGDVGERTDPLEADPPSTLTVLHTRAVAAFAECRPDCEDVDQDGLNDRWEDAVLAKFRPTLELDEKEKGLTDARFRLGIAGRVVPREEDPARVVVFFALVFSEDYGTCGFTDHHGDIERAAIEIELIPGTRGDARWVKAFTSAHEGDVTDKSHLSQGEERILRDMESTTNPDGTPGWLLYASRNKHAIYTTKKRCESSKIPCLADHCGGGSDPRGHQRVLDVLNAGEPDHPRDARWDAIGYPGADAWADGDFCGLATGGDCDAPPRASLVRDPFTRKDL